MIYINDYICETDSESFEKALSNLDCDRTLVITPRMSKNESERNFWLIDRAILIPENTTVIMRNATIKLSDKCRDNFFRTANCGMGIEFPERIKNVHLKGEGLCTLLGADHPRATGDGSKMLANPCPYEVDDLCKLAPWIPPERRTPETIDFWDRHDHSYGTDAGKEGESQYGDWRGIGVLFANVENFSISGLRIVESHGWGISLEECAKGYIRDIEFDACMSKVIDGLRQNMENQDGIDLRNGCHDIMISDITGGTGDDVIALTAIAGKNYIPGGSLRTTHVMHNDWTKRDRNIHDIIIRNVCAHTNLCWIVRLLPAFSNIYNIVIDGIIDNSVDGKNHAGTFLLGDAGYGENYKDGLSNITISNAVCNSPTGVEISEYLIDSVISNIVNKLPCAPAVTVRKKDGLCNVKIENCVSTDKASE